MVLNAFKSRVLPLQPTEGAGYSVTSARMAKVSDHSSLKIGIPKQMLQRLTRALAQVKAGNTCMEPQKLLEKYIIKQ